MIKVIFIHKDGSITREIRELSHVIQLIINDKTFNLTWHDDMVVAVEEGM